MIEELRVENLAIIDRATLRLGPGFTALTGETGGGKSLLIDAVELALGGRADPDQVRSGARGAALELTVNLAERPDLIEYCHRLGVSTDGHKLVIRRDVMAEGKSQCRIGGRPTPVSVLKQLGAQLVDLHGQHDHQSLLDPGRHLGYLDGWIGEPAQIYLASVTKEFEAVQAICRKLAALRHGRREMEQRIDLLRYQVAEIASAAPLPGELDELMAESERLANVDRLSRAAFEATSELVDAENSAYDATAKAIKTLEAVATHDARLTDPLESLRSAAVELQDAAHTLRGYAESLEADPRRLDSVEERMEVLRRLRKKYGDDEAAILVYAREAQDELDSLTFGADDEDSLALELSDRELALHDAAEALTALRRSQALTFAEVVQVGLRELAMDRSVFEIAFNSQPVDASGADKVEFFFSANAGEPPRPLAKIVSGGELSRVMLAIKSVYAGKAGVPTLVFDEVDAGLGGRAAAAVARKLAALGERYQVLVISHLPQIASAASHQFRIEKSEANGRAQTTVTELSDEEREIEIARMLAGEHVTETALANARDLLRVKAPI